MAAALDGKIQSWLRTVGPTGVGELLRPLFEGAGAQASVADGTTLTNSVTETTLASATVVGLEAGDVLEIDYLGTCPSTNSTDTLTLKLKVGTEVICTTAATDVVDDDVQRIHAKVVIRTSGSTGTLIGFGEHVNDADGTAPTPFRKAQATEDLTGAVTIAVTGTWSVAHADNQVNAEALVVKHVKAV